MADWSALPEDLLAQVAERLAALADRLSFSRVCKSWQSASACILPRPTPGLPFLLLHGKTPHSLVDVANQKACSTLRPPRPPRYSWDEWTCFGSCHSWVGLVSWALGVRLHNPISGKAVRLPSLRKARFVPDDDVDGMYVDTNTDKIYGGEPQVWPTKLCMSSPEPADAHCVVMVIRTDYGIPQYTRAGCEMWRSLEDPWLECIEDIVYHSGKFYAWCDRAGASLVIVSIGDRDGGDPGPNTVERISISPEPLYSIHYPRRCYLVAIPGGEGELVLASRFFREEGEEHGLDTTEGFVVMRILLDMKSTTGEAEWVEMKSLGGRALFLGANCSTSISASVVEEEAAHAGVLYRANCIYFTHHAPHNACGCEQCEDAAAKGGDVGVFSLEDGSIAPLLLYCTSQAGSSMSASMWIIPNPHSSTN